ncbi:MAG: hypothetical protein ACOYUZ_00630 [Patescibacteria group bacterium]
MAMPARRPVPPAADPALAPASEPTPLQREMARMSALAQRQGYRIPDGELEKLARENLARKERSKRYSRAEVIAMYNGGKLPPHAKVLPSEGPFGDIAVIQIGTQVFRFMKDILGMLIECAEQERRDEKLARWLYDQYCEGRLPRWARVVVEEENYLEIRVYQKEGRPRKLVPIHIVD